MRDITTFLIRQLASGGYKAYIWGQPDFHYMDRRGCNYRYKTVEGQPVRGFSSRREALTFLKKRFSTRQEVWDWARGVGDGSFLTNEFYGQCSSHSVYDWPEKMKVSAWPLRLPTGDGRDKPKPEEQQEKAE